VQGGLRGGTNASFRGGGQPFPTIFEKPRKQKWREEFLNRKLPHFKDEIGLRHIFTVKNATDQRNSGNLGCKNKYKRQNHGKKEKLN
jgi:hypothetical protein